MHGTRQSTIPSLPVSFVSVRHPERLEVIGIAGTRRHGDTADVTLTVRCGCFRVFEASRVQIQQGLVSCCDACAFVPADREVSIRAPRHARCARRA
jgi:hypothetical protein